jgi:hypothetical protein
MKLIKTGMRFWIAAASIFSFFAGWALFAHSGKPAPLQFNQPSISAPATEQAAPILRQNTQANQFPFSNQSQFRSARPRFRTGGS